MLDFSQWLIDKTWLIPLLPLLAAAWIGICYLAGFNRGERGEKRTTRIALGAAGLSLLLVLLIDLLALINGAPGATKQITWLQSGDYRITIAFLLDSLGLTMATLVALLSFLGIRFSVNYMHREAGYQRFFMIFSLFMSAMLLIVMSANAALTFVGWELAGVSSYLLIGYAFDRNTATHNANRAFITNRIGDAGFILGLFLGIYWLGDLEWLSMAEHEHVLNPLQVKLIAGAFVIAALAKSAQVPFAGWIARALEGPTPSSALFYGALMVHAGVYLLLRLEAMLLNAPMVMVLVALLGAITVIYGYLSGLVQTDVKSRLLFATTTQAGLMFVACGLGLFDIAAVHLVLHALWRGYQFLHAPAMMHLMNRPVRPAPQWLTRHRGLYTAALRRFWLDPLADALLVRPTESLGRDLSRFDEQVINRLVGMPNSRAAETIGTGSGLMGRLMERIGAFLHWFEERLVLRGSGEGLIKGIQLLGGYAKQIEDLLARPRYLVLMIAATFVVIL